MKMRKGLTTVSAAVALVAGMGVAPQAMALSGLLHDLLPPIPDAPAAPPLLQDLPGILPANLPDGAIPDFVLELPLPIPQLALPALPLPPNAERNTVGNCGAGVDLTQRTAVFVNNLLPNNQIEVFARGEDGSLCSAGRYNTGGAADLCGIVCSAQNPVQIEGRYIFATSPGSADGPTGNGSVAVFRLEPDAVTLVDVESSGGPNPRNVARSPDGSLVYVSNGGLFLGLAGPVISVIPGTLQGYRFDDATGNLTPISNTRSVDAACEPGDTIFTGDGANVITTCRRIGSLAFTSGAEPDNIEVYTLGADGTPVNVNVHDVGGDTPFGGRMFGNALLLTMGGPTFTPNLGRTGSFQINPDGSMDTLTPATRDEGTDTCWNAVVSNANGNWFYTSAFFDSQIAKWTINADGSLSNPELRHASSNANSDFNYVIGEGGLDMDATVNGVAQYVYVTNAPIPPPIGLPATSIAGFSVDPTTGDLTRLGRWVANGLSNAGFGMSAL